MAGLGNLVVKLSADNRKFNKGLGAAQMGIKRFAGAALAAGASMGAVFGGAAAFRAAGEQIAAERKLAATLNATGNAAGFTAKQLQKEAAALQKVTNFGDEAIIGGQAVLATFKNIKGDVFSEATKAALDMSAVMGTDLQSSVVQLGKALNDPIAGMSALSRVGVSFTDQQRMQIKLLQESGDLMGAQRIILNELKGEFGGAAAAMADPFIMAQNEMGDMAEGLGFIIRDIGVLTMGFFNMGKGAFSVSEQMAQLREKTLFVTSGISFLAKNWRSSLELMQNQAALFLTKLFNQFWHVLTVRIPKVFEFLVDNPTEVLKNGFAKLKIPEREIGTIEQALTDRGQQLGKVLGEGWNDAFQKNVADLIQPKNLPAVPAFGKPSGGDFSSSRQRKALTQKTFGGSNLAASTQGPVTSGAIEARTAEGFNTIIKALSSGAGKRPDEKTAKATEKTTKKSEELVEQVRGLIRITKQNQRPQVVRLT